MHSAFDAAIAQPLSRVDRKSQVYDRDDKKLKPRVFQLDNFLIPLAHFFQPHFIGCVLKPCFWCEKTGLCQSKGIKELSLGNKPGLSPLSSRLYNLQSPASSALAAKRRQHRTKCAFGGLSDGGGAFGGLSDGGVGRNGKGSTGDGQLKSDLASDLVDDVLIVVETAR